MYNKELMPFGLLISVLSMALIKDTVLSRPPCIYKHNSRKWWPCPDGSSTTGIMRCEAWRNETRGLKQLYRSECTAAIQKTPVTWHVWVVEGAECSEHLIEHLDKSNIWVPPGWVHNVRRKEGSLWNMQFKSNSTSSLKGLEKKNRPVTVNCLQISTVHVSVKTHRILKIQESFRMTCSDVREGTGEQLGAGQD